MRSRMRSSMISLPSATAAARVPGVSQRHLRNFIRVHYDMSWLPGTGSFI